MIDIGSDLLNQTFKKKLILMKSQEHLQSKIRINDILVIGNLNYGFYNK